MYAALFLFLVFFNFVESHVPMLNYWDELATFLVLCWGARDIYRTRRLEKHEWINWGCLAGLVVIGALGNLVHPGLQPAKAALVKDVIALCKFPAIFFVLQRRECSAEKQTEVIACAAKLSRVIVVVTVVAVVVGRFVDVGFYLNDGRFVPTFRFAFSHPTFFVSAYAVTAAALLAESVRKNRVYLLLNCFLIFMAQRSKGHIFVVFLMLFILLGDELITKILTLVFGSEEEKIKPGRLLAAAAVLCLAIYIVGKPRIEATIAVGYLVPRTALHIVGIQILMDFFPLGSGLGTFASYLSGRYYSNIYDLYGISNIYGMTREWYNFISDVFWPYIYGQFGIFGLLIYLKLIISIFFRQFRAAITDNARISMAALWIYALIASTSEAYFTNGTGVQMALFLGLFVGYGGQKAVSEKKAIAEE